MIFIQNNIQFTFIRIFSHANTKGNDLVDKSARFLFYVNTNI